MRKIIFSIFEFISLAFVAMCVLGLLLFGRDWFTATVSVTWGLKRQVITGAFFAAGGIIGLCVGFNRFWKDRTKKMAHEICMKYKYIPKDYACPGCPIRDQIGLGHDCKGFIRENPFAVREMYKKMIEQEKRHVH